MRLDGHVAPKAFFTTTVNIERKGYSILHIDKYEEDYLITMPKIHIEGLMSGSLSPELSGTTYIRSSSGYTAKIDYSSRGWMSGKKNSFLASLFHDNQEKHPLYTAEGQWSGDFTIKNVAKKEVVETYDTSLKTTPLQVAPLEHQHPLESRKAWQHVVAAIERNDYMGVGKEKSKIENGQREMRKREKASGTEHQLRYFSKVKRDLIAEKLADGMCRKMSMKGELGAGHHEIWAWDEEKYRKIQRDMMDGVKTPTRTRFHSGVGGIIFCKVESVE